MDVLSWFVRRGAVEVTFEEVHRHLGVETQRLWSDKAILQTTPCLLALFSMVTLVADQLQAHGKLTVQASAWYEKHLPTFSDALAGVRMVLWRQMDFSMSPEQAHTLKIPHPCLSG